MCQAYEAERAFIVWQEDNATVEGYQAAAAGKPNVNPETGLYRKAAWQHGYDCFAAGIVPYAVEKRDRR